MQRPVASTTGRSLPLGASARCRFRRGGDDEHRSRRRHSSTDEGLSSLSVPGQASAALAAGRDEDKKDRGGGNQKEGTGNDVSGSGCGIGSLQVSTPTTTTAVEADSSVGPDGPEPARPYAHDALGLGAVVPPAVLVLHPLQAPTWEYRSLVVPIITSQGSGPGRRCRR
jgi:hypothetical protein